MSEITEYALVVMASMLLVSGSVEVYNSFSGMESRLQLGGTYVTISGLAYRAVATGTANATIAIPSSTISCENSALTLSFGSLGIARSVPVSCDFVDSVAAGEHSLAFTVSSGELKLVVD